MPRLVTPSAKLVTYTPDLLDVIESAARKCYLSEPKTSVILSTSEDRAARKKEQAEFLRSKIKLGHHSILEHGFITIDFVFDRGVSHEEVRHRFQAISQESSRYCNYSKNKFGSTINVITPHFFDKDAKSEECETPFKDQFKGMNKFDVWFSAMQQAERHYLQLIAMGAPAEQARSVLPMSLKTEMRVTTNVREWRHILKIRTEAGVHPQMAEIMVPLLCRFSAKWPVLFDDIHPHEKWDKFLY